VAFDPACQQYRPDLAVYLVTAANDEFFALPDNVATLRTMPAARSRLAVAANMNHALPAEMKAALDAFAASAVGGSAMPWLAIRPVVGGDGSPAFTLDGPAQVQRVELYVADVPAAATAQDIDWPHLTWRCEPVAVVDGAVTPSTGATDNRLWFVHAVADSGLMTTGVLYHGRQRCAWVDDGGAGAGAAGG
jgi:hypothetical protein